MVKVCSDMDFHKRIAGKYKPGNRRLAGWPRLFYLRAGTGGQSWNFRIRLDYHLTNEIAAPEPGRDRGGIKQLHLSAKNISSVGRSLSQGIKLLLEGGKLVYHTAGEAGLVAGNRSRSGRLPPAVSLEWNPLRNSPAWIARPMAGNAALPARPGPSAMGLTRFGNGWVPLMPLTGVTSLTPLNYRSAGLWHPYQELVQSAGSGGAGEKSALQPGQPLFPAGLVHRPHPLWGTGFAKNSTSRMPRLMHHLLQERTRVAKLTEKFALWSAGQSSPASEILLPEQRQLGRLPDLRPSTVPGLFRKEGQASLADSELVLKSQRNIELELEELKKGVAQIRKKTAETVFPSASPDYAEIRKLIDLERISDQVYRTIERRIRQERERRGL